MNTEHPFAGVPAALRDALQARGFKSLTAVQTAIATNLATSRGKSLRISSQTGSGKTVALGIAVSPTLLGWDLEPAPPPEETTEQEGHESSDPDSAEGDSGNAESSNSAPHDTESEGNAPNEIDDSEEESSSWASENDSLSEPEAPAFDAEAVAKARKGPQVLVITPTRELASQVQAELAWLYEKTGCVEVQSVTGGTDTRREKRDLTRKPRILVGTPGRLLDHIRSGNVCCESVLEVVLDEADQMLDMGFKDELDGIVDALPAERRSHLVSATFPGAVRQLARRFQPNAITLEGTALGEANSDIQHLAYLVNNHDRYNSIVNLLLHHHGERCLIFVERRSDTTELSEKLAGDGFGALPFSGDLAQAQRTRTLNAFKNGTINTLVATDVAARGIDVPGIGLVIHGDLPKEPDAYTHRSGRTGRAGTTGQSLIIVPINAERRAQRLLRAAGIDVQWTTIPNAKKIQQRITKATRRDLYTRMQEETASELELEYATTLLEREDPAQVVAHLLKMAETPLPRAPLTVGLVEPRPAHGGFDDRRDRGRSGDARPSRRRDGRFVRFFVNWGAKHGANANRVLSHICRRGEVDRSAVGSIEVSAHSTIVEVSETLAQDFEKKVRAPDTRDPMVKISRDQGSPGRPGRTDFERPAPRRTLSNRRGAADGAPRVARAARGRRGPGAQAD